MLPGVRFVFGATILAVSVVIFGLGAAAFLRAAHENLASATTWRPIDDTMAGYTPPVPPTLAMLRADPEPMAPVAEPSISDAAMTGPAIEPAAAAPPRPETAPATEPQAQTDATPRPASPERETPAQTNDEPRENPAEAMAAKTVTPSADSAPPATAAAPPADSAPAAVAPEPVAPKTVAALVTAPTPEPVAPTVVETPPALKTPPAAVTAQDGVESMPGTATMQGADTLRPEDRQIKTAMVTEPALTEIAPLPAREVRIPVPRIDPSVLEARRKRLVRQQQARASRAAKARRIAAVRARQAAQARAAAPDPFGTPSNTFPATQR